MCLLELILSIGRISLVRCVLTYYVLYTHGTTRSEPSQLTANEWTNRPTDRPTDTHNTQSVAWSLFKATESNGRVYTHHKPIQIQSDSSKQHHTLCCCDTSLSEECAAKCFGLQGNSVFLWDCWTIIVSVDQSSSDCRQRASLALINCVINPRNG